MHINYDRVEDLVTDEGFLAWYYKSNQQQVTEWERRLANDPALKKLADEATLFLDTVRVSEKNIPARQLQQAEQRLMSSLATPVSTSPSRVKKMIWWSAAAAILVIAAISAWPFLVPAKGASTKYKTQFSEIRNETLPDGSEVTLNANSELLFDNNWSSGNDREVWISGEAFFHVKSTPSKDKFIVHSGNFDIIVTGTQFNVVNRDLRNNVLLKSGSITVKGKDGSEICLTPGEFLEFAASGLQKKIVNETPVVAWKERKLMFEKTAMREVAASIREVYGISVVLADESVASIPISGIFPNDNLDIFLKSLEASQDFDIQRSENSIRIKKR